MAIAFPEKTRAENPNCSIIANDCRIVLRDFVNAVDLIVTSPPYADARQGHYDSIHPDDYPEWFRSFHKPFWDALKPDGSFILNIKDKVVDGVRHRYVWHTIEMLTSLGWNCIDDYIWHKTNPMPGFWPTRLRDGWEYCFHLSKSKRPFMDQDAVRIPIGNWAKTRLANPSERDVVRHNSVNESGFGRDLSKWIGQDTVLPTNVMSAALVGKNKGHPAVFPPALPFFFIKLFCPKSGLVVDPFAGSGSTGIASLQLNRNCILIDNNANYCETAYHNLSKQNTRNEHLIELMKPDASDSGVPNTEIRHTSHVQLIMIKERLAPYGKKYNGRNAKKMQQKKQKKS
jgi:DNA modification methylase